VAAPYIPGTEYVPVFNEKIRRRDRQAVIQAFLGDFKPLKLKRGDSPVLEVCFVEWLREKL
jgi:hypothetical protein